MAIPANDIDIYLFFFGLNIMFILLVIQNMNIQIFLKWSSLCTFEGANDILVKIV